MRAKLAAKKEWPLRFVADSDVSEINPAYETLNGRDYPFVSMDDVREECQGIGSIGTRPNDSSGYTVFRNGDTLFAKITPCTENGKITLVRNLPGEVGLGSTEFIVLSARSAILPEFLYFQLIRGDIRALCASLMEGSTGRQRVPTSIFRKRVRIPVPPSLDEQRAIAGALLLCDLHITATKAAIAAAERLQQGLIREMLAGRIRTDGTQRTDDDFTAHPKLGLVPIGWNVEPLKKLAEIQRGRFSHRPRNEPRFYGGPHPFIQTGEVSSSRGYIRSHNQTLTDEGAAISRLFPKGTVFISIVGANVAKAAIASYDVYAPDSVIGMIPTGRVEPEFLELWLRLNQTRLALLAGDSARENLNYTILKPRLVAFPETVTEQREIAGCIYDLERLIEAKRAKITALQRLKKSLMQNLLTGRMRLSAETITALNAEPTTATP